MTYFWKSNLSQTFFPFNYPVWLESSGSNACLIATNILVQLRWMYLFNVANGAIFEIINIVSVINTLTGRYMAGRQAAKRK